MHKHRRKNGKWAVGTHQHHMCMYVYCVHTNTQCEPEIILYFVSRAYGVWVRMKQRIKIQTEVPHISYVRIRTTHTIEPKKAPFILIFHVNCFHFFFSAYGRCFRLCHCSLSLTLSLLFHYLLFFLLRILSMTWVLTSMAKSSECVRVWCTSASSFLYVCIFLCERMWTCGCMMRMSSPIFVNIW